MHACVRACVCTLVCVSVPALPKVGTRSCDFQAGLNCPGRFASCLTLPNQPCFLAVGSEVWRLETGRRSFLWGLLQGQASSLTFVCQVSTSVMPSTRVLLFGPCGTAMETPLQHRFRTGLCCSLCNSSFYQCYCLVHSGFIPCTVQNTLGIWSQHSRGDLSLHEAYGN